MAVIKKYKNGKITIKVEEYDLAIDGTVSENIYHDGMFMADLYINQINGYQYIVDQNTKNVYALYDHKTGHHVSCSNPLVTIMNQLDDTKKLVLYPVSKREAKSLLEDLENGF